MKFGFQGLGAADATDDSTHHDVEICVTCGVDLADSSNVRITRWYADNRGNRRMLNTILESGNVICGQNTHWIEQRQSGMT
jgi:hypothetical protein